jgi:hypothetical protein
MFISVSSQPNNNIESFRFVCEAILHLRSSQHNILTQTSKLSQDFACLRLQSIAKQAQEMWHAMKQLIHIIQASTCAGRANRAPR